MLSKITYPAAVRAPTTQPERPLNPFQIASIEIRAEITAQAQRGSFVLPEEGKDTWADVPEPDED